LRPMVVPFGLHYYRVKVAQRNLWNKNEMRNGVSTMRIKLVRIQQMRTRASVYAK
jgi:hypothetical protein